MNIKSYRRMENISRKIINIIIPLIMTVSTSNGSDDQTEIYDMGKNIKLRICNFKKDVLSDREFSCYFGKNTLVSIKKHQHSIEIETGCAYIDIYNLSDTDMGQYMCGINDVLKGKRLIVQGKPTVKINEKNLTSVAANEPSVITCERYGSSGTKLTIKLGNKDLGGTIKFLSSYLTIKRIIYNFDMIDTKKTLTCSASVENASEFHNVQVINVKDSPCIDETRNFEFMYNDKVTLRKCSNLRSNKIKTYGPTDIKNEIYHVPPNRNGTYTCIKNNEKGNTTLCHYNITFKDDGKLKFLNCHRNVSKYNVKLNSSTTLNCSLNSSSNISSYEWYYNDQLMFLGNDQIYVVTAKGNNSYYSCTAENEDGNSKTCMHIITLTNQLTLTRTKFLNCHRNVSKYNVKLNSSTTLNCSLNSSSNIISYEWYYNNQLMFLGKEQIYVVTAKENNSYYSCTAENEDGNSKTCMHIITLTNQLTLTRTINKLAAGAAAAGIVILLLTIICIIIQRHKYEFNLKSPRTFYNSVAYYFSYQNEPYGRSVNDKNDDIVSTIPRLEVTNLILIGAGNFGPVYKGYSKTMRGRSFRKPIIVAVKLPQVRILQAEVGKRYLCQIDIHYQLAAHNNVISCYGRTHYNGIIGSILEYAPHGSLKSYLQTLFKQYFIKSDENDNKDISELNSICLQFCLEIAAGMSHLNRSNIIHMNLSAKNVLLGENFICKVTDFGLNYIMETNDHFGTYYDPIPIRWMSPESITYNSYTRESDVWTYGIVLWEIITLGFTPYFEFKTGVGVKEALHVQYRMALPNHCSSWLNDLIQNCWDESAINRPSFDQIEVAFKNLPKSFQRIDFTKYDSTIYEKADLKVYREIIL